MVMTSTASKPPGPSVCHDTMLTLLILLPLTVTLSTRYDKYREIIRSLDDWERALLRDFVRAKGRGSVSRIPVELLNEPSSSGPDLDVVQDDNFVSLFAPPESALRAGPMMTVPRDSMSSVSISSRTSKKMRSQKEERPVPSVILPASKAVKRRPTAMMRAPVQKRNRSELEEPTQETFKELSGLLQTFIDRRKPFLQRVSISSATTPASSKNRNQEEKPEETSSGTSAIGQWEAMNPEDDIEEQEGGPRTSSEEPHQDWEEKMRELSGQLSTILMQIKKAKESRALKYTNVTEKPKPKVSILRNGSANQTNDGRYNFVATITLVQDSGKNILVDTGLGTDMNGRVQLLNALEKHQLEPLNVNIVVTTHGHPDHAGGVHDFPEAIHYQGWYIHHRTTFNLSNLFEGDRHSLTENVHLMRSTGHSSDDVAVVVNDEKTMGKVIIAGDTFMRREDLDHPMMWQPLSANETEQALSRRNIICDASWIVPGHGAPFQVTRQMRVQFGC
ncbi:hypothetical protein Q1695_000620 [Nippostrongylus brasiliensis]|nr:hypothetical protein Q1695_000620 [Nippostrongylus brasiliensis]